MWKQKESFIEREKGRLNDAMKDGFIIHKWRQSHTNPSIFFIEFKGPLETVYEKEIYTIRIELSENHPFTYPSAFFEGDPPNHPFYAFDTNDTDRLMRMTNLANHPDGAGLFHKENWTPLVYLLGYIERLHYSLTLEGTKELWSSMYKL